MDANAQGNSDDSRWRRPRHRHHAHDPLAAWERHITFSTSAITVDATLDARQPLDRVAELLPVARFKDTALSATTDAGDTIAAPWPGRRRVREVPSPATPAASASSFRSPWKSPGPR